MLTNEDKQLSPATGGVADANAPGDEPTVTVMGVNVTGEHDADAELDVRADSYGQEIQMETDLFKSHDFVTSTALGDATDSAERDVPTESDIPKEHDALDGQDVGLQNDLVEQDIPIGSAFSGHDIFAALDKAAAESAERDMGQPSQSDMSVGRSMPVGAVGSTESAGPGIGIPTDSAEQETPIESDIPNGKVTSTGLDAPIDGQDVPTESDLSSGQVVYTGLDMPTDASGQGMLDESDSISNEQVKPAELVQTESVGFTAPDMSTEPEVLAQVDKPLEREMSSEANNIPIGQETTTEPNVLTESDNGVGQDMPTDLNITDERDIPVLEPVISADHLMGSAQDISTN